MKKVRSLVLIILFILINQTLYSQQNVLLKKIIGTWRLIEYADKDAATGQWKYDYGKHPKGFFTYTKTGIVNLNIAADSTLRISEYSAKNYNVNLLNWVYNYSVGYFGTLPLIFEKSIITHHVTGGSLPWYVDTDQRRPFIFETVAK